jgi:metallo-beta-lactamase family protein
MSFSDRTDEQIRTMKARIDDLSWGFELYDTFTLKNNITFTLKNAGHILGSCFIQFSFPGAPGSAPTRVTFSGDLGCRHTPILPDPDLPDPPAKIRLVHGEPKAQTALAKRLNT